MATGAGGRFPLLAPALIVGLALVWGINWPIMKIALLEFPVWTFRAGSSLAAGLSLLALARLSGSAWLPRREEWRGLALAGLFNVTLWQIFVAYGLQRVGSGHAAVLAFTMPLWAAFLGWAFLGEKIGRRGTAALILGLAGILTLLAPDFDALSRAPVGAAITLAGAFGWAIGTLIHKRYRWSISTIAVTGWQVMLGTIPMLIVAPLVEGVRLPHASTEAWLAAFYTTFLALVFGYFAWFKIVRLIPVQIASISTLLIPGIGIASGAWMLGESVGASEIFAFVLIGIALALVLFGPRPAVPEPALSGTRQ
jgi:drug/metabolite transporter (DMT)-like permease